jgi:hypothetical protein
MWLAFRGTWRISEIAGVFMALRAWASLARLDKLKLIPQIGQSRLANKGDEAPSLSPDYFTATVRLFWLATPAIVTTTG